jgi:non-specific serine/threonine protein kinase
LAGALWWFWFLHDHWSEGREWLERALARSDATQCTTARAKALEGAGLFARDWQYGEASVALFRELDDSLGLASSLRVYAMQLVDRGNLEAAQGLCEESLAIGQPLGDRWGLIPALWLLGHIAFLQHDYATAHSRWEESHQVCREVGDQWNLAWSLNGLGHVASRRGEWTVAQAYHEQSLPIFQELESRWGVLHAVARLAQVAGERIRPERAARLFGAADALLERMGVALDPHQRAEFDSGVAAARAALGEEHFAAAWALGRAMTQEEAVAEALQDDTAVAD